MSFTETHPEESKIIIEAGLHTELEKSGFIDNSWQHDVLPSFTNGTYIIYLGEAFNSGIEGQEFSLSVFSDEDEELEILVTASADMVRQIIKKYTI
jgi:hypothetical protein